MLELEALGDRLDDQLARGELLQGIDRLRALGRGLGVLVREPAFRRFPAQAVLDPRAALLERLGDRVIQQRLRPRAARELGDARAHRAGAEHADEARRLGGLPCGVLCLGHARSRYAGTIALIPVIWRPMISFWIWEVPS